MSPLLFVIVVVSSHQMEQCCAKTSVLRSLLNILLALDSSNTVVLALLDLSAASDNVDDAALLSCLRTTCDLWWPIVKYRDTLR